MLDLLFQAGLARLQFGGARLDTLYITSANSGGVWALRPGSTGLPEARFKG